jgi:hypothetical protein
MYSYLFYGYLAYRVYGYISIVESVISVGSSVINVYRFLSPLKNQETNTEYLDWVLISEQSDSLLHNEIKNPHTC